MDLKLDDRIALEIGRLILAVHARDAELERLREEVRRLSEGEKDK